MTDVTTDPGPSSVAPADSGAPPETPASALPPLARIPVGSAVAAVVLLLMSTASRYGYHRDELYFLMLKPAWGYIDQPPLTPLLARAAHGLFGNTVWGLRVPAVLCAAAATVIAALIARELGGDQTTQGLAAWTSAAATATLLSGHLMATATVDLVAWGGVLLCVTRALLRSPRWWVIAGGLAGVALFNKLLIVLLLIGLGIGLAAVGPRSVLRDRWLWSGVAAALVVGSPNLIYQATHHFPQLTMAGALSRNNAADVRTQLLPLQVLLVGLPLAPIVVAGFAALLRRSQWRPLRAIAVAYLVVLGLTFATGGQAYYPYGLLAFALAAGCVPAVAWVRGGAAGLRPGRLAQVGATVAVNLAVSVLIALPVLPVRTFGSSFLGGLDGPTGDQVGWVTYVRTLADAYLTLSPDDRAGAVVFTGNYGEAGAVHRYGPDYGLPPAYSAQNELYLQGPPPAQANVVLAWTQDLDGLTGFFATCQREAGMDNGVGVDNEEQGSVVAICRDPVGGWAQLWPKLRHYD